MTAHRSRLRILAAGVSLALAMSACSSPDDRDAEVAGSPDPPENEEEDEEPEPDDPEDPDADEGQVPADEANGDDAADAPVPAIDPAEVEADELGVIPVMMYHQLRDDGGSDWDMTPDEFRAELVRLFDSGYVPVRADDMVRGQIDVPAGMSPVVLTFDDSVRNQARLDEDGEIASDTSIGVLNDVAADYDHIEPVASLYVITSSMFGGAADGPDIVRKLHEIGMELGNHTHTHANLRSLDAAGVQEELARNVAELRDIVPDAEVVTLSLPFGISPENRDLVAGGSSAEGSYTNEGVFLVGDRPSPSPFHADFDPLAVPRIKTLPSPDDEFGSAWWLDQLEAGQTWRPFVSDGDPATISFPAERGDELHPDFADRANPY